MTVIPLPDIPVGCQPPFPVACAPMAQRGRKPKIPVEERPAWARRLMDERLRAGFTNQEKFADKIGKSQSAYGAYETGESEPDIATWNKIGDLLGLNPSWLAFGTGSREPDNNDAAVLRSVEANQDHGRLYLSLTHVAQMLDEEQFGANLPFLIDLSRKIAKAAEGTEDQLEARELIRRAVERERQEIRQGLEKFRQSRL